MKFRPIEDKQELWILIQTTLEEKKEPFTLGELVEDVFKDEAFNKFCSKEILQIKTAEVIASALSWNVIGHYPQLSFSGKPKYMVVI